MIIKNDQYLKYQFIKGYIRISLFGF